MPALDITPSQYALYPWLYAIHPEKAWLRGRSYLIAKRIMDIFLICLALPLLLPLFLLIGLFIQLESPGAPVIFFQMRTGRGGIPFRLYKFRTMVPNAEAMKEKLAPLNELQWPDFKITNDPRITRVGKLLRKTSLDELPQLINVLRGEMSLVGPRPTSFSVQTYQLWQTERLMAIPGLTGLWQIVGRGTTEFDARLRMDIAYIEHACLWLDIQLLARTILSVLLQRGAH
jgi:lipopolysaccharide/colanic/teichoic acid biosynthesis glycosyltransferase